MPPEQLPQLPMDLFAFVVAFVVVEWLVLSVLFRWAKYEYVLSRDALLMRRTIFGRVSFGQRTVPLYQLRKARVYSGWMIVLLGPMRYFGNYHLSQPFVVLTLTKGILRRTLISPKDPEAFVLEIRTRLRQLEQGRSAICRS